MPRDHTLKCFELCPILSSGEQFDASRRGMEITAPEVELQPPARISDHGPHLVPEMADQLLDIALRPQVTTKAIALSIMDARCSGDYFATTRTGNFLMPLMKLLRTLFTSPFNSIEVSRGISSVNKSRISIRASALPKHTWGLPLPKVR